MYKFCIGDKGKVLKMINIRTIEKVINDSDVIVTKEVSDPYNKELGYKQYLVRRMDSAITLEETLLTVMDKEQFTIERLCHGFLRIILCW